MVLFQTAGSWGIPLHDGTMSVGLVLHKTTFKEKRQQSNSLEEFYLNAIDECPLIAELLSSQASSSQNSKLSKITLTSLTV